MQERAVLVVLLSAFLHASWNALLKGCNDRARFMVAMCSAMSVMAVSIVFFVPLPDSSSWRYIGLSALLHLCYNLLLLKMYRVSDLSSGYPIARGISPLLVTLTAALLMKQWPARVAVFSIVLISSGIVCISAERHDARRSGTIFALATGISIAAYTVVDSMGVHASGSTISYIAWVFSSYCLTSAILMLSGSVQRFSVKRNFWTPTAAAAFSLLAYGLVLWATRYEDVGIVSAIRETSVLWAVVLGYLFLKEEFSVRRFVSSVVIVLGVVLLIVQSQWVR